MKIQTAARAPGGEPPRATAYYYADLERLKRKGAAPEPAPQPPPAPAPQPPPAPSEAVALPAVANDGAVREVPPLRDRGRLRSLPDYHTPENVETYSTAGTFPMPEPREKEPLLAELEAVGRVPLAQLGGAGAAGPAGVRRSRSWYLCCPDVDDETSRDSSWRYSSLRPVTAPPAPGHNGLAMMVATQSSGREDAASLRAERDALARALAAERQRAATAARAHDARLAELHGVIAELVRRRAHDKQARAIPEEDVSDECESTTQPAGELDNDADHSRTDQNDTSSALSPELPTPQESKLEGTLPPSTLEGLPTDTDTSVPDIRADGPRVEVTTPSAAEGCDTSLNLSERDSDVCLSTARCCEHGGGAGATSASAGGSCERERGSPDSPRLYTSCTDRCESRQAKLASRVRLRKTEDTDTSQPTSEQRWCTAAAEQLALDVCAHADLREAVQLLAAHHTHHDGDCAWAVRCARLRAERRVLQCALARAADTAHRLYCACAVAESSSVALCCALRAADRALEVYDVLLALAETAAGQAGRGPSERVARQLLARLDQDGARLGEPLLSPGPWLQHHTQVPCESWTPECEARLRAHAARLKAETVALRDSQPEPKLFSYHDIDESELCAAGGGCSAAEMEAAVALHDALSGAGLPGRGGLGPGGAGGGAGDKSSGRGSGRRPRRARPRHWLDAQASETDL